jgi:hypothetical protein
VHADIYGFDPELRILLALISKSTRREGPLNCRVRVKYLVWI